MTSTDNRGRHRHESRRGPSAPLLSIASAMLAASIAAGAGSAFAVPQQGGTNPGESVPQQGGTNPGGSQGPGSDAPINYSEPSEIPGPGSIPGPPVEAPYQPYTPQPQYDNAYNPGSRANNIGPAAPVRPIAPPVNKIRVGNFITDIPPGVNKRDVNSLNAWAAYGEAKIAQNLIAAGVPKDEASRRAAATIIGVAIGGTAGAAAGLVPGAVVGALVGLPAGALIGAGVASFASSYTGPAIVGVLPFAATYGTLIGTVAGPFVGGAVGGVAGAAGGAIIGGAIGGTIAYTLGAGDPGANPQAPWQQGPRHSLPDPHGPNQFEYHLPAPAARAAGLPAVDYVVTARGDVKISVGASTLGWSAEQARVAGSGIVDAGRAWTRAQSDTIKNLIPGGDITWPTEASAPGKHRA
ncbi:hypothetical protein QSJ18_06995 [Gordonia sp. ABSL1-1]|uniref:hypothetical protein n=1 Tax=Gordonia sp. ABSL1-1 TaxID=3053923 RepID=UPI002573D16B|nr:hypothetical protein [Gordonia sp. ABSL1-1]MDL9936484.1 hypothetical protein [Gordonia sp. ABSL1-1]